MLMPAWEPQNFAFSPWYAIPMRSWSKPLQIKKEAKLEAKGTKPAAASPEATPTMFASLMPMSKKRSGNLSANFLLMVDFARSASSTTSSGISAPNTSQFFAIRFAGGFAQLHHFLLITNCL